MHCQNMINLYNYCLKVTEALLPEYEVRRCFDRNNPIYGGAYLKQYNDQITNKCRDFVLPVFAFESLRKDLTKPGDDFCSNAYPNIAKALNARVLEIQSITMEIS